MDNLCVGLATLAVIIMIRSVGSVVGSVASGFVCDRYYKYSFWMLVADIIISGLCKSLTQVHRLVHDTFPGLTVSIIEKS